MKWYQHESGARNDIKIRKLRKKFGLEGYAVYFIMLEIIAEYATERNVTDWGFVDKYHDVVSLAEECGIDTDDEEAMIRFKRILEECNKLELFEKREHRLYCGNILKRLDTYAQRVRRQTKKTPAAPSKKTTTSNGVHTKDEQSTSRREENRKEENISRSATLSSDKSFDEELEELIELLEETLKTKITNTGKQRRALKMILDADYTVKQAKKAIQYMANEDEFWIDKGFDLMNVANQLPIYKAESEKERTVT